MLAFKIVDPILSGDVIFTEPYPSHPPPNPPSLTHLLGIRNSVWIDVQIPGGGGGGGVRELTNMV